MPTYRLTVREVHETVYEIEAQDESELETIYETGELPQPTECKYMRESGDGEWKVERID